jgi:hypothetical protein
VAMVSREDTTYVVNRLVEEYLALSAESRRAAHETNRRQDCNRHSVPPGKACRCRSRSSRWMWLRICCWAYRSHIWQNLHSCVRFERDRCR